MKKLSAAQQNMLDTLSDYQALDSFAMLMMCGKNWKQTWKALEAMGLVRFFPYAKDGMHYRKAS